ncbi:MAG TPA: TrbC/VirB2 family protein [Candidatus Binataceae bacterium]|nr:TrbC/VirB2 family protein [Candidatus Binataceae bacterium]
MNKLTRVISFGVPLLLLAAPVLAATTGTPMDTVTQQVLHLVSGPIALLMIVAGFVGAGLVYFMGRNFEAAFLTLSALAIGGVLCSQIQPMATYLFPTAGALIR